MTQCNDLATGFQAHTFKEGVSLATSGLFDSGRFAFRNLRHVARIDVAWQLQAVRCGLHEGGVLLRFRLAQLMIEMGDDQAQFPVKLLVECDQQVQKRHRVGPISIINERLR